LRLSSVLAGFDVRRDPLRLSPGLTVHLPEGMFLSLGGDVGLSSKAPLRYFAQDGFIGARIEPVWRVGGAIGFSGFLYRTEPKEKIKINFDSDNDGIPDTADKCPQVPEDKDGFQDEDGCPDYDNDNDHLPDSLDKCPNEP
jgi:outer membrane protein OmpA-like peptidoglycan-associated protein